MLTQVITVKAISHDELQDKLNEKLKELYSPVVYTIVDIQLASDWKWYVALIVYRA